MQRNEHGENTLLTLELMRVTKMVLDSPEDISVVSTWLRAHRSEAHAL